MGRKKGFTLVEVIVVLVILAILAAILIPALTAYIDKANRRAAIAECRNCVTASQTLLSEAYGNQAGGLALALGTGYVEAEALAEVPGDITTVSYSSAARVEHLIYLHKVRVVYCYLGGV